MTGRHETQSFFVNQQHFSELQSASICQEESLTEAERHAVESYADKVADEQNPATALDFVILTKSNLLEGKGIWMTVVDDKGKFLLEETYPGTDPKSGNIKLLLTETPLTSQRDEDHSRELISDQNCIFHAIIQATTDLPNDRVKEEAMQLRKNVSEKLCSEPFLWGEAVKIQSMFNNANKNNKFKIEAGIRKADEETFYKYIKDNKLSSEKIIEAYKLGEVDEYKNLLDKEKPTPRVVEADHIPPMDTMRQVHNHLKENPKRAAELKKDNEELYNLIMRMDKDQNGKTLICMNTLHFDHKRALTTGNSKEARACRKLLAQTILRGDVLKALKLSLIMAHPSCSDHIRKDLGIKRNFRTFDSGLSAEDTNSYYNKGFEDIVTKYCEIGVIDQEEANELQSFIKNLPHNFELSEYTEINYAIKKPKACTSCFLLFK